MRRRDLIAGTAAFGASTAAANAFGVGKLGSNFGRAGLLGGGARVERVVTAGGQAPIVLNSSVSSPKVRLVGTVKRWLYQPMPWLRLHFMNARVATGGAVNGPADFTINKYNIWQGSNLFTANFGGSRSRTVTAGSVTDNSDQIFGPFAAGWVYLNFDITVSTSGYVYGKKFSTSQLERDAIAEVAWLCDPSVTGGYDVDTASVLTIPSGGAVSFPISPVMITGPVSRSTRVACGGNTSLGDGVQDHASSDGSSGGGMYRRCAYSKGWAYTSTALNGMKYNDVAGTIGKAIIARIQAYSTDYWMDPPTNDVAAGSTRAACRTLAQNEVTRARANGIQHVYVNNIVQRVSLTPSNDRCTTLVNQTNDVTGYGAGGVADGVNIDLALDVGSYYDAMIDIRVNFAHPSDDHFWKVDGLQTTLAAAIVSTGATTASFNASVPVGSSVVFEPGTGSQSPATSWLTYLASGSGPYSATAFIAVGVTHLINAPVQQTHSFDGTHGVGTTNATWAQTMAAVIH